MFKLAVAADSDRKEQNRLPAVHQQSALGVTMAWLSWQHPQLAFDGLSTCEHHFVLEVRVAEQVMVVVLEPTVDFEFPPRFVLEGERELIVLARSQLYFQFFAVVKRFSLA